MRFRLRVPGALERDVTHDHPSGSQRYLKPMGDKLK